jgi:hypothetical protein
MRARLNLRQLHENRFGAIARMLVWCNSRVPSCGMRATVSPTAVAPARGRRRPSHRPWAGAISARCGRCERDAERVGDLAGAELLRLRVEPGEHAVNARGHVQSRRTNAHRKAVPQPLENERDRSNTHLESPVHPAERLDRTHNRQSSTSCDTVAPGSRPPPDHCAVGLPFKAGRFWGRSEPLRSKYNELQCTQVMLEQMRIFAQKGRPDA